MTDAVIGALEAELRRERERIPLADKLAGISGELLAKARPGGHDMGKDEIDAMWGHSFHTDRVSTKLAAKPTNPAGS